MWLTAAALWSRERKEHTWANRLFGRASMPPSSYNRQSLHAQLEQQVPWRHAAHRRLRSRHHSDQWRYGGWVEERTGVTSKRVRGVRKAVCGAVLPSLRVT